MSDARQLVQPGACCLVLAVRVPREEQETATDDHDRRTETDSHPDRVEDEDPEHAEQQESDARTGELEGLAHRDGV